MLDSPTALLWLRRDDDTPLSFELAADPERGRRALAHGAGFALAYFARDLVGDTRDAVLTVAATLAAQPDAAPTAEAIPPLVETLARSIPRCELELRRIYPRGQRFPEWPAHLRAGRPATNALWPIDAEMAGLRAGLRRIVKREPLSPAQLESDRAWMEENALVVRVMDLSRHDRPPVVFGALSDSAADAAVDAERIFVERSASGATADASIGDLLGYPPCCVKAFLRQPRHDDRSLAAELLPPIAEVVPAAPYAQWLTGPLGLVSHSPCAVHCEASQSLGRALLAAIDAENPGYAERWTTLAQRLHVVAPDGRTFALALDGAGTEPMDGLKVVAATELVVTDVGDPLPIRDAPDMRGATVHRNATHVGVGGRRFYFAADHRRAEG